MSMSPLALQQAPSEKLERRLAPTGVQAGAPLTRITGPQQALGLVREELAAAEAALSDLVMSDVAEIPEVAGYLLDAGGKRLRPALTALGAMAVGDQRPIVRLMCAGELIHLGSLLHDDVVDQGALRRGRPAAQLVHGNPVSVLTGDFCLARAVLLASEEGGHAAVTALAKAVTEMAEGEVLQLQRAGDLDTDLEGYFDVIDRKSAALIAWCVSASSWRTGQIGYANALQRYGRGVGVAFQITDDVLDFMPGTGKAPGTDLRERKVTLPLLMAFERVPGLRDRLREGPPDAATVAEMVEQIRTSGALDAALAVAREHVNQSLEALQGLPESPARDALAVLGSYLVDRAS